LGGFRRHKQETKMDEIRFTDETIPPTGGRFRSLSDGLLKRAYYNGKLITIYVTREFLEELAGGRCDLELTYEENREKIEAIARVMILKQKPKVGEIIPIQT
jgi:hypothetical protein